MISLEGVTSELVARNESWVRRQAQQLAHRLPANVERADLIQAGLIAVAQASLTFRHDPETDDLDAQDSFVRYARQRVRGAMLDELRQMDSLARGDRRRIKVVQIARERWLASNGQPPTLAQLAELTSFSIDTIARLDHLAASQHAQSTSGHGDDDAAGLFHLHPATEHDEVEARVDTAIVMRHLERFFARLPERDRRVIDAYLGVGLSPVELAASMQVTPSRVSRLYHGVLERLTAYFDIHHHRAIDRIDRSPADAFAALVDARERELDAEPDHWVDVMDDLLGKSGDEFHVEGGTERIEVGYDTRWG